MKNKFVIALALFLGLIFIVSSCDTRDDYFYEHCDEPVISFVADGDSSYQGSKFIVINLKWGETKSLYFDFFDKYGGVTDFEIEALTYGDGDYTDPAGFDDTIEPGKLFPFNEEFVGIQLDKEQKIMTFTDKTVSALSHLKDGYIYDYGGSYRIYLLVKNKLGKPGYANIFIHFTGNNYPNPEIFIEDTDNNLEKEILVAGNDPDGDEILKYEYCIDGTICNNARGYEVNGYLSRPTVESGKAAYNGTYITATSNYYITHAFQYTGKHTINVRCQDKWGLWSDWVTKKINID